MDDKIYTQEQKRPLQRNRLVQIKYLLIVFGMVVAVIVGYFFIKSRNMPTEPSDTRSSPRYHTEKPGKTYLSLLLVEPQSGEVSIGNTRNSISLAFDVPVDLSTINITSNPTMNFTKKIHRDRLYGEIIVLQPTTSWEANTDYVIIIRPGIKSVDGSYSYNKEIRLNYSTLEPEEPTYTSPF